MCKLFLDWKREIQKYCVENGLDFSKVEKAAKCCTKDMLALQHFDPMKGKNGLLDETPAPVTLVIRKMENGLAFEQTEHTRRYLS